MKKISLSKLDEFFAAVAASKNLYLPVDGAKGAEFKLWTEGTAMSKAYNTLRSAKDFFFPQVETLAAFKVSGKNIEVEDIRKETEDFVIFGVRACDAKSFEILDTVYLADPVDSYYASRREHGVVVTLSCKKPTETCFCKAFGIDATNPGGDVACWMTDDELLLQANTEKGEALLASLSLLEDAADDAADSEKEKLQTILDKLPLGNLSTESFGGDKLMALFNSAIELILDDKGHCAGAVLLNMETKEILIAKAKVVIIATGGAGRMHYQGFPTSNHYGATADGLVLAYRVGAPLREQYTLQYHPTGAAFPEQIFGALVTEKVRSLGAKLVNVKGEVFMNPLETRDVTAATVIRECRRGNQVNTPGGQGVWLDTPMIDLKNGEGTIEKRIPAMLRMFGKYGIDIRKQPILIYPTLHYQNGGVKVGTDSQTCVENLFVAGEAAGGVHGENRLMGNSLLDVIVFGRNAGKYAAAKAKDVVVGNLTLDHVAKFEKELEDAGITPDTVSPMLLPDYTRKVND